MMLLLDRAAELLMTTLSFGLDDLTVIQALFETGYKLVRELAERIETATLEASDYPKSILPASVRS